MEHIGMSEKTWGIISRTLGVSKPEDIMNMDYPDITVENDVDREKAIFFGNRFRGSIRLGAGLFYTANEYKEYVDKVRAIKLP